MKTIIVTGGAGFCDKRRIFQELDKLKPITRILVTDASKVEKIAGEWAAANEVRCAIFLMDYTLPRSDAVAARHAHMLEQKPSCVIAFPGGASTFNLMTQAIAAGVEVIKV